MADQNSEQQQVKEYLVSNGYKVRSITELSGGHTNFVFRVELNAASGKEGSDEAPPHQEPNILILKHALPHVKANPSIHLSTSRQDVEAALLHSLPDLISASSTRRSTTSESDTGYDVDTGTDAAVSLPTLLIHDPKQNYLLTTSGGPHTLKTAYAFLEPAVIQDIGRELYGFVTALHETTKGKGLIDDIDNGKDTARRVYHFAYGGLPGAVEKLGLGTEERMRVVEGVRVRFGGMVSVVPEREKRMLCHGDFWPGNVVLLDSEIVGSGRGAERPHLTVIDWELARTERNGATDLGQFAAEATLLDVFRGSKGLCKAFLEPVLREYESLAAAAAAAEEVEEGNENRKLREHADFVARILAHWATHILFWPMRLQQYEAERWTDDVERLRRLAEKALAVMAVVMDEGGDQRVVRLMEAFEAVFEVAERG